MVDPTTTPTRAAVLAMATAVDLIASGEREWLGLTAAMLRALAPPEQPDAVREAKRRLCHLVNTQAEDEGLWFGAQYASEAYLQQELRKLHAAVEALAAARGAAGGK